MVRATGLNVVMQVLSSGVTVQNTAVAEDSLVIMSTDTFQSRADRKGLVVCHGYTAQYDMIIDDATAQPVIRGLLDSEFPWVIYSINTGDDGGANGGENSWGNDLAVARVDSAVSVLKDHYGVAATEVYGMGISMGMLPILNSWKATNANFASTIGIVPIISLSTIESNNIESAAAAIDTAYGGTYVEATEDQDHDPDIYIGTDSEPFGSGKKVLWMYAGDDEWQITPVAYSDNRYTVLAAANTECEAFELGTSQTHSWTAIQLATTAQINGWLIDGTVPS